jgi:hypothetical protein
MVFHGFVINNSMEINEMYFRLKGKRANPFFPFNQYLRIFGRQIRSERFVFLCVIYFSLSK